MRTPRPSPSSTLARAASSPPFLWASGARPPASRWAPAACGSRTEATAHSPASTRRRSRPSRSASATARPAWPSGTRRCGSPCSRALRPPVPPRRRRCPRRRGLRYRRPSARTRDGRRQEARPPIAADMPLQGVAAQFGGQLNRAIIFTLQRRHFRAGRFTVGYQAATLGPARGNAPYGPLRRQRPRVRARTAARRADRAAHVRMHSGPPPDRERRARRAARHRQLREHVRRPDQTGAGRRS